MSKLKEEQNEYIAVIHHNSNLLEYFCLGTLSKNEVKIVFGILEIIHNRYPKENITIPYSDIAAISKYATELYENNTNNQFERFIESIQTKLKIVSYKLFTRPFIFDYPIFELFSVDHTLQFLSVHISESVYQDEMMDDKRNIVREEKRIVDLFSKEDWSGIQVYQKQKKDT